MDLGLQGKRAAVGGSSAGLGLATARALVAEGVQVAICGRHPDRLAEAAAELGSGAVAITMLSASDKHMYQPGLLYVPFGKIRESELFRDQRKILDKRVAFFVDPAEHIDVEAKSVKTKSGKTFTYDYLVIATGSRIRPDMIPGMAEGANWFYDLDGARKMREALNNFKGGKIVVNVA